MRNEFLTHVNPTAPRMHCWTIWIKWGMWICKIYFTIDVRNYRTLSTNAEFLLWDTSKEVSQADVEVEKVALKYRFGIETKTSENILNSLQVWGVHHKDNSYVKEAGRKQETVWRMDEWHTNINSQRNWFDARQGRQKVLLGAAHYTLLVEEMDGRTHCGIITQLKHDS